MAHKYKHRWVHIGYVKDDYPRVFHWCKICGAIRVSYDSKNILLPSIAKEYYGVNKISQQANQNNTGNCNENTDSL
jgi:hypothetical protein